MYVGGVLKFRKLNLMVLRSQFDVTKVNFRGLVAKIGHLKPNLASRNHLRSIFMQYAIGTKKVMLEGGIEFRKLNIRVL